MPMYEYRCTSCGEHTELLQHLGDAPPSECPRCGGPLVKVFTAPSLRFKGTGWYVNDYGTNRGARAGADGSTAKDGTDKTGAGASKSETGTSKAEAGTSKTEGGASKTESGASKPAPKPAATADTAAKSG
jgi:putative FmdB family regulatory protein